MDEVPGYLTQEAPSSKSVMEVVGACHFGKWPERIADICLISECIVKLKISAEYE